VIEPVAAPTQVKLLPAEFAALWVRYTISINGTRCRLESGFGRGGPLIEADLSRRRRAGTAVL